MPRFIKAKKEEIGMSPEAFIFRGNKKMDSVFMRLLDYNNEKLEEIVINDLKKAVKYKDTETTTWLNIDGIHDSELMRKISEYFNLNALVVSEVMNPHARPKFLDYDNFIYISVRMIQFNEELQKSFSENLVLILKKNILISFQEVHGDVFDNIRERIKKSKRTIRTAGTDYLAVALIDAVFENYNYVISRLGEKIEALDEKLTTSFDNSIVEDINYYKREIVFLQKNIKPCYELILNLDKIESDLIAENLWVHIQNLKEIIEHANESLDSYRAILADQLNVFHTNMAGRLNDIMKFLTVFSVIFIPLTFVAGIYGTNFPDIPEFKIPNAYLYMWIIMILIVFTMIYYFKKRKWL